MSSLKISHLELLLVGFCRPGHGLLVLVDIEPDGGGGVQVEPLLELLPDVHDGLRLGGV